MTDDKFLLLKMHPCTEGLSDEAVREVAEASELLRLSPGEYVHRAGEVPTSVFFVIHGRLKQSLLDLNGEVVLERFQPAGGQFGGMASALGEPVPVDCAAEDPSTLLRLDYRQGVELTRKHPALRSNLSRMAAEKMLTMVLRDRHLPKPKLVGVLHESSATRLLTKRLATRLAELGEAPCVLSDDSSWKLKEDVRTRILSPKDTDFSEETIRRQINQWIDSKRIIFDFAADYELDRIGNLVEVIDRVFWCVTEGNWQACVPKLQHIFNRAPGWRDKSNVIWLLEGGQAPLASQLRELVSRDFKISFAEPGPGEGHELEHGFERLVHFLRGVQIGVALGGGAARGMAHLGVLKALGDHGVIVDMIAGTSAGAMTGTVFASGMGVDYAIESFVRDLRPSWFFRCIPRGDQWYLLYKYRRGHFDPMLRKYLRDKQLEQLPVPMNSITVDLVGAKAIVRDSGDAVHGIVESINLPVLAAPINRHGQALVDGGLVNNVPADVLVSKGCNFVIAVSVTAKMELEFARNRPETPTHRMKRASTLQTLLRSYMVQSANVNSLGVQPADIVIEPDVTSFELTEFTRTDELAAIGEQATLDTMPQIKKLLSRLDDKLFSVH